MLSVNQTRLAVAAATTAVGLAATGAYAAGGAALGKEADIAGRVLHGRRDTVAKVGKHSSYARTGAKLAAAAPLLATGLAVHELDRGVRALAGAKVVGKAAAMAGRFKVPL